MDQQQQQSPQDQHQQQPSPQEQQTGTGDRRRPFSVSDANRGRTNEIKIYNTTTITTTTSTSSSTLDSQTHVFTNQSPPLIQNTRYVAQERQQQSTTTTDNNNYYTTTSTTNISGAPTTSAAAVTDNMLLSSTSERTSRPHAYNTTTSTTSFDGTQPPPHSATSRSYTTSMSPSRKKIRFVYGGQNQQDIYPDPQFVQVDYARPRQIPITHTTHTTRPHPSEMYVDENVAPPFPQVHTSISTINPTTSVISNTITLNNPSYTSYTADETTTNQQYGAYESQLVSSRMPASVSSSNVRVKDVEVECEIEEDPSIFEGSEGYVRNLISKIQTQYRNPETVHIKITRKQRASSIDKYGNLVPNYNSSYGQIIRKEYYTIKSVPLKASRSSGNVVMGSFTDTAHIPYIDDESGTDSRTASARSSRLIQDHERDKTPPYIIEKHVVYDDSTDTERRKVKEKKQKQPKKQRPTPTYREEAIDVTSPEVRSGIKGFLKGIGGKIKAPDVYVSDVCVAELDTTTRSRSMDVRVREPPTKEKVDKKKLMSIDRSQTKAPKMIDIGVTQTPIEVDVNLRSPREIELDTSLPNVDIEYRRPVLKEPKVEIVTKPTRRPPSEPPATSKVDVHGIDVTSPEIKGGIKGFFKGIGGKIKAPDVHLSDMHPADVKVVTPDISVEAKVPKAEVDVKGPKLTEIKAPPKSREVSVEVKAPKIKDQKQKEPKMEVEVKEPQPIDIHGIDVTSPEIKGGIKGFFKGVGGKVKEPQVKVTVPPETRVEVKIPQPKDISPAHVSTDTTLPKVEIEIKEPPRPPPTRVEVPKVPKVEAEIEAKKPVSPKVVKEPKVKTPTPKVPELQPFEGELEIHAPKIVTPTPRPKVEHKIEKPTMPEMPHVELQQHIDVSSPEIKGGIKSFFKGIGGKVKAPDVHITAGLPSTTKKEHEIQTVAPDINLDTTLPAVELDIHGPKVVQTPRQDIMEVIMPKPGKVSKPAVEIEVKTPSKIAKEPKMEMKEPKIDLQLKEPTIGLTSVEQQAPPGIDITAPEIKGGVKSFFKGIGGKIKAPDVHLSDLAVKAPKETPVVATMPPADIYIDTTLPNVDIEGQGPKVREPVSPTGKAKPSPKPVTPKTPKKEIALTAQQPRVDLELPTVQGPTVDIHGIDVTAPEIKGGIKGFFQGVGGKIKAPDVSAELKTTSPERQPKVHVTTLPPTTRKELEIRTISPDINLDTSFPTVEVDIPRIESPRLDVQGPKVDVVTPTKTPSRTPTKSPVSKERKPKDIEIKAPKVDLELKEAQIPTTNVDLQQPPIGIDVTAPEIKGGIKGFFKGIGGKIKAPEVYVPPLQIDKGVKGAQVEIPTAVDNVDIAIPTFEIDVPDKSIHAPKVEMQPIIEQPVMPRLDIDLDTDLKSGVKGFFKGAGGKIKEPQVSADLTGKAPADIHLDTSFPKVDIDVKQKQLQQAAQKQPKVDVGIVPSDLKIKAPVVDIALKEPHVPSVSTEMPEIKGPEMKGTIKGMFKGIDAKIKAPDVHLSDLECKVPKHERDISVEGARLPTVDIEVPRLEQPMPIEQPQAPEIKGGVKGFFKGIGGKIKAPELQTTELHMPDVAITSRPVEDIHLDTSFPTVDIEAHGPTVKKPTVERTPSAVRAPKVEIKEPKIEIPKVDVTLTESPKIPEIDVELPEIKGGIKGFFKGIGGKIKAPDVTVSEASIRAPSKAKKPIAEPVVSTVIPDLHLDTTLPTIDVELQRPEAPTTKLEVDVRPEIPTAPKVEVKTMFKDVGGKIKEPATTTVTVETKSPKVDVVIAAPPKVDVKAPKLQQPKIETKAPKVEAVKEQKAVEVAVPSIEVKEPKVPDVDLDAELKGGIKGFFKGIGGKIKAPDVSAELKTTSPERPPKVKPPPKQPVVQPIDVEIDTSLPNVDLEFQGLPSQKFPKQPIDIHKGVDVKADVQVPEMRVEQIVDIESPELKGGLKGFFSGISAKIKAPDVHVSDLHLKKEKREKSAPEITKRGPKSVPVYVEEVVEIEPAIRVSPNISAKMYRETVQGFDLPMTIVNNDWHWSLDSSIQRPFDRKFFYRSFVETSAADNVGDISFIQNSEFSSSVTKQFLVDAHGNKSPLNPISGEFGVMSGSEYHSPNVEYELRKAIIRKDASSGEHHRRTIITSSTSATNLDNKSKSSSLFRSGTGKSESSVMRSESAEPVRGSKIDYSVPRKCYLFTKPDFDGLGIHIACDKKTRRSPYIHDVEETSPGQKSGLRKGDRILEINNEDCINMDFKEVIARINQHIRDNDLCLTVGNEKATKKYIKSRNSVASKKSSSSDKIKK